MPPEIERTTDSAPAMPEDFQIPELLDYYRYHPGSKPEGPSAKPDGAATSKPEATVGKPECKDGVCTLPSDKPGAPRPLSILDQVMRDLTGGTRPEVPAVPAPKPTDAKPVAPGPEVPAPKPSDAKPAEPGSEVPAPKPSDAKPAEPGPEVPAPKPIDAKPVAPGPEVPAPKPIDAKPAEPAPEVVPFIPGLPTDKPQAPTDRVGPVTPQAETGGESPAVLAYRARQGARRAGSGGGTTDIPVPPTRDGQPTTDTPPSPRPGTRPGQPQTDTTPPLPRPGTRPGQPQTDTIPTPPSPEIRPGQPTPDTRPSGPVRPVDYRPTDDIPTPPSPDVRPQQPKPEAPRPLDVPPEQVRPITEAPEIKQKYETADMQEAVETARKAGLPLVVHIGASWCPPCQSMEANVYPTIESEYKGKAVFLHIDVDQARSLRGDAANTARQLSSDVRGYPTIRVFNVPQTGDPIRGENHRGAISSVQSMRTWLERSNIRR